MEQARVAFLSKATKDVQAAYRKFLPEGWTLSFAPSDDISDFVATATDADFIIGGGGKVTAEMIEAAPRLRLIHKPGVGVDKIDLVAAAKAGVPVAITAGANAVPVAEHALMMMLAVSRRLAQADRQIREGRWARMEIRAQCYQLSGKVVGIVGFGNIGQKLAQMLSGFGVEILYYDPRRVSQEVEQRLSAVHVTMEEILEKSDILSLHLPLTSESTKIIDDKAMASMKEGAILINTARGELVDEDALYAALLSGHLRGAGLDTFVNEPPSRDNPLFTLDQVVVSPHMGGGAVDNVENVAKHIFGNMVRVSKGEKLPVPDTVALPAAS